MTRASQRNDAAPTLTVPVVMFHGVCDPSAPLPWHYPFWLPVRAFETFLRYLDRRGYETVHLDAAAEAARGQGKLLPRAVVITFDDALLDNWVYAWPLLQRYGAKATIYVPTDFVADRPDSPPHLGDVRAGRILASDLDPAGALSWADLRTLAGNELVSIQSHGRTHTWYPVSGRILDFCHPGTALSQARSIVWNRTPEAKPRYYQSLPPEALPLGAPVLENELSLAARRFLPEEGLEDALVSYVSREGGPEFFLRPDWRDELRRSAGLAPDEPAPGRMESDEEFRWRLLEELRGSRALLEERLGRPVRHFAWPNGGACPEAVELLAEAGYHSATVAGIEKKPGRLPRRGVVRVPRFAGTMLYRSRLEGPLNGWALVLKLEAERGNRPARLVLRSLGKLRSRLGGSVVATTGRPLGAASRERLTAAAWRRAMTRTRGPAAAEGGS